MKKIRCNWVHNDYIKIELADDTHPVRDVIFRVESSDDGCVRLSTDKIRKLRKQLKRALVEIEGEPKEADEGESNAREEAFRDEKIEYKPGDRVYLIHGNNEGPVCEESPSVVDIDLRIPVTLVRHLICGDWSLEYTMIDGDTTLGFSYEKYFGRRA